MFGVEVEELCRGRGRLNRDRSGIVGRRLTVSPWELL